MGDVRFEAPYRRVADAEDRHRVLAAMTDSEVIAALAGATNARDPYLANVLASEAQNRVTRKSTIVETAEEGIVAMDADDCLIYMNPAAERMLGWTQAELSGQPMHDQVHYKDAEGRPIPAEDCAIRRIALADQTTIRGHDDVLVRKDGTTFPVSLTAAPVRQEGDVVGVVVTFTDVTERVEAAARIRESEERKRAVLEASLDAIITIDETSTVVEWNPAAEGIFGYSAEEAVGRTLAELIIPPGYRQAHYNGLERYLETGEGPVLGRHLQLPAIRKDGSEFPAEIAIIPTRTTSHTLFTGYLRDITERQRVEADLKESEARMERLLERVTDAFIALDREWRFTYMNAQAEHVLQRKREDLIGRGIWDEFPDAVGSPFEEYYEKAFRTQEAQHFEAFYEGLNAWYAVSAYPSEEGLSIFFRDVTKEHLAEEQLKRSEEMYRHLFAAIPDAVLVADTRRGVLDCNEAFTEIFGYDLDEIKGHSTRFLYESQEDFEEMGRLFRTKAWNQPTRRRLNLVRKDGEHVPAEVDARILEDDVGRVRGFIGIIRDLSAERRVRAQLEKRARQQAAIAEVGVSAMERLDVNALLREITARIVDILDVECAEVLELTPRGDRLRLRAAAGWDEDAVGRVHVSAAADEEPGYALQAPEPVLVRDVRAETRFTIPSVYLEQGAVSGVNVAIRGRSGPWGVLSAHAKRERAFAQEDIDFVESLATVFASAIERRRAEDALRESQLRFRSLAEATSEGVVISQDGITVEVNRAFCEMFGYDESELVGEPTLMLVASESREKVAHIMRSEREGPYEARGLRRDGSTFPAEVVGKSIQYRGRPARVAAVRDVTERKRAERVLRQAKEDLERRVSERTRELALANQELESFSYSVSHDLRAPLRGIDYLGRVLNEDYADEIGEEGRSILDRLQRESMRASRLVQDLLALSRVSRSEITRTRVDLSRMAREVADELKSTDADRPITFDIADGVEADADPQLIRQVLQNLMQNAWKYTGKESDGLIAFRETEIDGERVFLVRDNGVGFDMADAHGLFEAFKRLHAPSEFEGTGIGLAIVHRVIQRHGGRIWAESTPGEGATFYFTLGEE